MLDIQLLRNDLQAVGKRLATRGFQFPEEFQTLEQERKVLQTRAQALQARRNTTSTQVGIAMEQRDGAKVSELKKEVSSEAEKLKSLEIKLAEVQSKLEGLLLNVPNIPHESVP